MKRTLLLALLLPLGSLVAQNTVVVPKGFAKAEGNSYHWMIGQYDLCRAQQIFSKAAMGGTPFAMKSIKLRRDGSRTSTFEAHKGYIQVFVSNRNVDPPSQCGFGWDYNHGPDKTLVMKKRIINWGVEPKPAVPPAPFKVTFPFDKFFAYKGKAFVIEWISDYTVKPPAKYAYNWVTDAELYSSGWTSYNAIKPTNIGKSCRPPGATRDPANYGYYPYPGSPFWFYSYWRINKANIPVVLFLGTSDKKWAGLTLPFDLTPLGAKGCNIYVNMVQAYVSKTDMNGRADFLLGAVPPDPALSGQSFYNQQFAFDPTFNALGMVSTWGRKYTVGTGFGGSVPGFCFYGYKGSSTSTFDLKRPIALYYSARANIVQFN